MSRTWQEDAIPQWLLHLLQTAHISWPPCCVWVGARLLQSCPLRCAALHGAGMLAGGTGIAPMYQVAQAILKNPNDKTQVCAGRRASDYRLSSARFRVL